MRSLSLVGIVRRWRLVALAVLIDLVTLLTLVVLVGFVLHFCVLVILF